MIMPRTAFRLLLGALLHLFAVASLGCGAAAADLLRQATPAGIEGAVEATTDPALQQKIVDSIEPERVAEGTEALTAGMTDGVLDALEEPRRQQRIAGAMNAAVGGTLDAALSSALSEGNQGRVRQLVRGMVHDAVSTSFQTARAEMQGGDTLGASVREVTKQATLGFQDAIDETRRKKESGAMGEDEGNVLSAAGKAAEEGGRALTIAGVGLGVFAIILLLVIIWAVKRRRSHRQEVADRDAALELLAETIKATKDEDWSPELQASLRRAAREHGGGAQHLSKVLRGQLDLQLDGNGRA
jgi:hypothetical protein